MASKETKMEINNKHSQSFYSSDDNEEPNVEKKSKEIKSHKLITRVKFLPSEDKTITELVSTYGTDWKVISQLFGPSRTKRQLRERWQNYLNPDCNPVYTDEEDQKLMELVDQLGTKWSKIAEIIGQKSAISCRNRHRILIKEKNKKNSLRNTKKLIVQPKNEVVSKTDENQKNPNSFFDDVNFDDFDGDEDVDSFFFSSPMENIHESFNPENYLFEFNLYDNF